jgi:hypothetical protein
MNSEIVMYVVSGACAFGLILLSAIYSELKNIRESLIKVVVENSENRVRICGLEKLTDQLPCLNNRSCNL